MSVTFSEPFDLFDHVQAFVETAQSGTVTLVQLSEFEQLLRESEDAQILYLDLVEMSVCLPRALAGVVGDECNSDQSAAIDSGFIADVTIADGGCSTQDAVSSGRSSVSPAPVPRFLATTLHGAISCFSHEIPFSFLIGAILTGVLVLVAWLVPVSMPVDTAKSRSLTPSVVDPTMTIVGKITGMVDCKWSKDAPAPIGYDNVLIGRRFKLDSGLMEITYETGAKVILQGPVTYEVDSRDGGFLSIGKLTAKLEKRAERREEERSGVSGEGAAEVASGQWPVASDKNPKSQDPEIPKSLVSGRQSLAPVFAVRTPTATVTDLGTEFGVDVNKEGCTASHVFRGSIQVQAVSNNGKVEGVARVLHENESAYVDRPNTKVRSGEQITVAPSTSSAAAFIREIPRSTARTFDLVDVIAGGDGFSQRRNRGISSSTGEVITRALRDDEVPPGDGLYHRVPWSPLIDGVFVPDGRKGAVQTDSAGHTFDRFSNLTSYTASSVWAGGKILAADPTLNIPTVLNGVDYSSKDHGLLFMHANKAVTFSLDAIRKANPGFKITRFLTMSSSMAGSVDAWFLVDGKERFSRCKISQSYSAMPITISIRENEHFLTLAVTDGGDGIGGDWMIFGDPRLEMISIRAVPDARKVMR